MSNVLSSLGFSATIVLPLLLMMTMGKALQLSGKLSDTFLKETNAILFNYALPALLFFSIVQGEFSFSEQWKVVAAGYCAIALLYVLALGIGKCWIKQAEDRGVFVQGVFRGNLSVLGLVLVAEIYGKQGLTTGAIFAGSATVILNVLGVMCLIGGRSRIQVMDLCLHIAKNPLIIAITLAFLLRALQVNLPEFIVRFGKLLTSIVLPLSLLSTGAVCRIRDLVHVEKIAFCASIGKVIISPIVFYLMGLVFGVKGVDLAILCIMGMCPAATAGYIMAKQLGANAVIAANIIALTTFMCLFLVVIPIVVFRFYGIA